MPEVIQTIIDVLKKLKLLGVGIILAIIVGLLYLFLLVPKPENTLFDFLFSGKKDKAAACETTAVNLYHFGKTNDNVNYVCVNTDSVRITGNLATARLSTIGTLLAKADSLLLAHGHSGYAKNLLRYFREPDEAAKLIIEELANRYILHMEEDLLPGEDEEGCYYNISLSLEVNGANDATSLAAFIADKICISNTLNKLIFDPLHQHNIAKVTFYDIYKLLCTSCPSVESVRKMIKECNSSECDNIYFERSQHNLSVISKMILYSLYSRLQKEHGRNITVEFHGFTDATDYRSAGPYNGGAHIAAAGTLLNDELESNAEKLLEIGDNTKLSFARASDCYDFIKSQPPIDNVHYYYTGWGVNPAYTSDVQKRSVLIIVKNN